MQAHFYIYMLSKEIENRHLDRFRQALYYLERFDTERKKWEIDKHNIVRREGPSGSIDKETNWGQLSHIDDWFIESSVEEGCLESLIVNSQESIQEATQDLYKNLLYRPS